MSGLPQRLVDDMIRYVRFAPGDGAEVALLGPLVSPHFGRITENFYERIREHEDAHAVFVDEAQVKRLHGSLVRWLGALFSGNYGAEHFAATAKVGWVHVKIGLPQRYMHTAMALIRAELLAVVDREVQGDARARSAAALNKLVDLELAVMIEAYCDHFVERLEALSQAKLSTRDSAIESMERRYVRAFERARVLVVGADAAGCVILFNREAERATGWARDEVAGQAVSTLLFPDDHAGVVEHRMRTVGEDDDVFFDAVLRTRSGQARSVRWQLARSYAADAPSPSDMHFFLIGHDVTDEVALAERTRRAERLAAVGTLAAGLAHEIRNPLNGAHLHLTLLERALKKEQAGSEAKESLATVASEIQRLSNLVTDFLQFARPQRMELTPTSLSDVAARAVSVLRPEAERRGVALTLEVPRTPIAVAGDAPRLEQVVLNLVKNAIEANDQSSRSRDAASGRSGGHVVARVFRTPSSAIVEVEDDGPGIAASDAPIFDAFYTTKPSGTGLGLSIAHRIAEDHGGVMTVDSAPGRTVFRLVLPRAEGTLGELS